jgi:putative ABC transport system permease protein
MWLATVRMALREIRRNGLRSLLTTLGIVIGVGSVIALVTLGRSASGKITRDIANMGSNLLIVLPGSERQGPAATVAQPFRLDDARAVRRQLPVVKELAATASRPALVVAGHSNANTNVLGAELEFLSIRGFRVSEGGLPSASEMAGGASVCLLGASLKRTLFGHQSPLGATLRVESTACRVVGVVKSKGQSALGTDQEDFVLVPLALFQRRIAGSPDVHALFMSLTSEQVTESAKRKLQALLRERRHLANGKSDDFTIQDMKELRDTLTGVTDTLTALLAAIAGVSLIVGGVGIMNIMLVSVTERTREIGMRLAIGARAVEVLLQFLVEAITLSTLGGLLGIGFGAALAFAVTQALDLPFEMRMDAVLIACGFSAIVGVGFGFLPARKAARLNPIAALRHE